MKLSILSFVQLALLAVGLLQVCANHVSELDNDIVDRKDHRVSGQHVIYDNATLEYVMEGHEKRAMASELRRDDEDMESALVSKRSFLHGRFSQSRNAPRSSNLVIERKIKHPTTNKTVIVMRRSAEITRMDQDSVSKTLSDDISFTSIVDREENWIFGSQSVSSSGSTSPMDFAPLLVGGLVLPIWLLWKTKKAKEAAANDGHEDDSSEEAKDNYGIDDGEPLPNPARRPSAAESVNALASRELLFVRAPVLVWLERAVYVLIICTTLAHLTLLFFLRHHQNDRYTVAVRTAFTFCFFATLFLFASYTLLYLYAAFLDASGFAEPIRPVFTSNGSRTEYQGPPLFTSGANLDTAYLNLEAAQSHGFRSFWLDGTSKLRLVIVGFLPGLLAGLFSYFFVLGGFMEDKEASVAWLFPATLFPQVSGTSTMRYLAYALIAYSLFVVLLQLITWFFVTQEETRNQHQRTLQDNEPQLQLCVIRQYAFLISLTLYHLMLFVVLLLAIQPVYASTRKLALFNVLLKHAFAGISLCLIVCLYTLQCISPQNTEEAISQREKNREEIAFREVRLKFSFVKMKGATDNLKTNGIVSPNALEEHFDLLCRTLYYLRDVEQMIEDSEIKNGPWQDKLKQIKVEQTKTQDMAAEMLMWLVLARLRGYIHGFKAISHELWERHFLPVLKEFEKRIVEPRLDDRKGEKPLNTDRLLSSALGKIQYRMTLQKALNQWIPEQSQRLNAEILTLNYPSLEGISEPQLKDVARKCRGLAVEAYVLRAGINMSRMQYIRGDDVELLHNHDEETVDAVMEKVTCIMLMIVRQSFGNDSSQLPKKTVLEQILDKWLPLNKEGDDHALDELDIPPILKPLILDRPVDIAVRSAIYPLRDKITNKMLTDSAVVMKTSKKDKKTKKDN